MLKYLYENFLYSNNSSYISIAGQNTVNDIFFIEALTLGFLDAITFITVEIERDVIRSRVLV